MDQNCYKFFHFLLKCYRTVPLRGKELKKTNLHFFYGCLQIIRNCFSYKEICTMEMIALKCICVWTHMYYFPRKLYLYYPRWQKWTETVFSGFEKQNLNLNFWIPCCFGRGSTLTISTGKNTLKCFNSELHRTSNRYKRKQRHSEDLCQSSSSALQPVWKCLICAYLNVLITHLKKYLSARWCHHYLVFSC